MSFVEHICRTPEFADKFFHCGFSFSPPSILGIKCNDTENLRKVFYGIDHPSHPDLPNGTFSLHWESVCDSGGNNLPACHCKNGSAIPSDPTSKPISNGGPTVSDRGKKTNHIRLAVIIVLGAAVGSFLLACLLFFITRSLWISSSRRSPALNGCLQLHTTTKVEKFVMDCRPLTATRYTYNDLMKMTSKFKHKIGQGGYGSVYKGWLTNGTPVAVKLMEKSYNDGEEFCNEVATIGRIHHVNVVRLLGFCVEGSRRALVYEFMANGSLEKFINTSTIADHHLSRERLHGIALGIARGIEYLHQGCDRRIIHFDIKPHNILLDLDFTPKISDFGLAKSYGRERSIVTITEGKGTIGYIAPEVFYDNSRHASHKADVYSFGMLLLSVVGMKENFGPTEGSSSEAYFPYWIHETLSKNHKCQGIGEGEDGMIPKMATIALWCIQWNPNARPCMKDIVRMLEGSTTNLTMPPNVE
ncbi:rust resistance kinase Lr10-like [Nymphaea colorata]|nr:rust resistance kinase Lr10-like [Nymphaea colorata]